jgi:hypothetical protein
MFGKTKAERIATPQVVERYSFPVVSKVLAMCTKNNSLRPSWFEDLKGFYKVLIIKVIYINELKKYLLSLAKFLFHYFK